MWTRRRSLVAVAGLVLLVAALLVGVALGGPIAAPPEVIDLGAEPTALAQRFDRNVGVPRLVLLLSPA